MASQNRLFDPYFETINRKELEKIQLKRLIKVLKNVYKNNPFYHQLYKEAGINPEKIQKLQDIQKLPFTYKEHLRKNYPYGMLAIPLNQSVEIHASSGTTATPTLAVYTPNDIEAWSNVMARCLTMAGLRKEDVFQVTPSFSLFTGGFGFYYGNKKIGSTLIPIGPGFSKKQIKLMIDLKSTMLAGIVSYALRLAETASQMGIDPIRDTKLRKGIFGAEIWSQGMKKRIAKTWNMDVYDIYGFTEACGPGVSTDCYLHDGLHIWEDHFLVEIIDPKTGEILGPEEEGELVLTTLTKEGMPIIRYRTRDITSLYDSVNCECGRTHRKHTPINGRSDDMLKIKGINVWPSQVEEVLIGFSGISGEYQIIVDRIDSSDKLTIRVESNKKLDETEKNQIKNQLNSKLREMLMLNPTIEIWDYASIPRDPGKPKRVYDLRSKKSLS